MNFSAIMLALVAVILALCSESHAITITSPTSYTVDNSSLLLLDFQANETATWSFTSYTGCGALYEVDAATGYYSGSPLTEALPSNRVFFNPYTANKCTDSSGSFLDPSFTLIANATADLSTDTVTVEIDVVTIVTQAVATGVKHVMVEGTQSTISLTICGDCTPFVYTLPEYSEIRDSDENVTITVVGDDVPSRSVLFIPPFDRYSVDSSTPFDVFSYNLKAAGAQHSGNDAPVTVIVTHVNLPPVLVAFENVTFQEDAENYFDPKTRLLEDDGPEPLSYRLTGLPTTESGSSAASDAGVLYQSLVPGVRGAPIRVGQVILDALIFVPPPNKYDFWGWFTYQVRDASNVASNIARVDYYVSGVNDPPEVFALIQAVTESRFANFNLAVGVFDPEDNNFDVFVESMPTKGKIFQVNDDPEYSQGDAINSFPTRVTHPAGLVRYEPVTGDSPTQNYASFTYSAIENDVTSPVKSNIGLVNVDLVANSRPTVLPIDVFGYEDLPLVITLIGEDKDNDQLSGIINSLPLKGTLYQYDDTDNTTLRGEIIQSSDPSQPFTPIAVTDPLNRVTYYAAQDESGVDYAIFTYLMSDGQDISNLGLVSISIEAVEDPPQAISFVFSVKEQDRVLIQLEGIDPDEGDDQDIMQYQLFNTTINNTLYQTDGTQEPLEQIFGPFPVLVTDTGGGDTTVASGGRLLYLAPAIPVLETLVDPFQYRVFIDKTLSGKNFTQYSNIATITMNVLGINNVPLAFSQWLTMEEDGYLLITLNGTDFDETDAKNLTVIISKLPERGQLSQYVDDITTQPDIINTIPTEVTDPLYRVYYLPDENGNGDPYDFFQFEFFDNKDSSVPASIYITVECVNDAPTVDTLPNLRAEDGTDIVIELIGTDVDSMDVESSCAGANDQSLRAIIELGTEPPSKLYQYIDNTLAGKRSADPSGRLTTINTENFRGEEIPYCCNTLVTDPLNRVILAAGYNPDTPFDGFSVSSFTVYFTDGQLESENVTQSVEVRLGEGITPALYDEIYRKIIAFLLGVLLAVICLLVTAWGVYTRNHKKPVQVDDDDWDIADAVIRDEDDDFDLGDDYEVADKPQGPLEELLLEDRLEVVSALTDIVEVTDFDEVAAALVSVFEFHNESLRLIMFLITKEVREATSAGTLFRSNSMASKVMTAYSKKVGGEYLKATLSTPIAHICNRDLSMEVDPRKISPGEDRKENMKKLIIACNSFVDWIVTSGMNAPLPFRKICKHLYEEVNSRFPQSRHSAIGGFLFLRFFCPAIISPEGFHILNEPPSVKSRRSLVLVAKALQNLANGVMFGNKEAFMTDVNNFIQENQERIVAFFEDMIETGLRLQSKPADVNPMELEEALNTVHRHLYENREEMIEVLVQAKNRSHGTGTAHTALSQGLTDGLTTFLHTHSLGDATNLNTSDMSGLTLATERGRKSRMGDRSMMSRRDRTLRDTSRRDRAGPKTEVDWDWGEDTENIEEDMSFVESDQDLDHIVNVPSEDIEIVGFGEKDEITDFDLSSTLPSDDETLSIATLASSHKSEKRTQSRMSRRMSRNVSQMDTDMWDVTEMSEISRANKNRRARRRSTVSAWTSDRSQKGGGEETEGLLADFVDFGEGRADVQMDEGFDDWGDEEEDYENEGGGGRQHVAIRFQKVLDSLGVPAGTHAE